MIEKITKAVKACAKIMLEAETIDDGVMVKEGHANFVTYYDKRVQDALFGALKRDFPEAVFAGEEQEEMTDISKGMAFIIDPIDGTSNFIKGYNCSCISVGVVMDGERYAGVIYDPYREECFTAERGKGAFLNGEPIHVSQTPLKYSLVGFGTSPYHEELFPHTFDLAMKYCKRSIDVRRSGSAALDLCTLACGRTGFFFELNQKPWDFSAGIVIIEEAGGIVMTEEGKKVPLMEPSSVFAMNPVIYEEEFAGI